MRPLELQKIVQNCAVRRFKATAKMLPPELRVLLPLLDSKRTPTNLTETKHWLTLHHSIISSFPPENIPFYHSWNRKSQFRANKKREHARFTRSSPFVRIFLYFCQLGILLVSS